MDQNRAIATDASLPSGTTPKIPRLIKRNTLLFTAAQAFVGMETQLTPALGPIIVMQLLGSASLAGIGISIAGLARFLIAYPIGQITDIYGRKAGLLLGLLLSLLGAITIGLSVVWASFPLFLAGVLIFGLGVGAGQQLRLAAADMYPPSRRAEGLGYVLTGSWLGAVGGPLLVSAAQATAPTIGLNPLGLAWLFAPAVIVPSIFLVLQVRPDPKEIAANLERYYPGYQPPAPTVAPRATSAGFRTFVREFPKRVAFVSAFAVQANMTMMMSMTALVLNHHGHALPAISLSVSIHAIGMYGFSLPLGRLADRFGRRRLLLAGLFLAVPGSLLVVATPEFWLVTVGIFLVGLGWSCVNVASSALIADTTEPHLRGRAIGTNDTFTSAASVVMPLVAGAVAEFLGFSVLGLLAIALMIPPFLLLMRLEETSPGKYRDPNAASA